MTGRRRSSVRLETLSELGAPTEATWTPPDSGLDSLTVRERQTVAHLAMGQSTKETAYTLGIAAATVRVLVARAAMKLGVRTRSELLAHASVRSLASRPA